MAPEEETECNVAHDGLGLRSGYRGVLAGALETLQADLVSSLERVRGWVQGTGGVDAGHGVHAGPLRGPKVNSLGRAAEGAKSCGGGGYRARGDLSPAKSCGGGGNQARGDLLDAESCGGGSSQARGDLRITTGSELWSSAGPRKSGRRRCNVNAYMTGSFWYCLLSV